jgi:peptidoglycan/xylan/chitin deacetylase (PgdA/CDA1 family)
MRNGNFLFFSIFTFFSVFNLSGISFNSITLSNDDKLLLTAEADSLKTLFLFTLSDKTIQPLTSFPEKLQLIDNGRTILAINRFGVTKIPVAGGLPSFFTGYPSFMEGNLPLTDRFNEFTASANGRWILYIEPSSPAYGNLFLVNTDSGIKRLVSEKVELPVSDFPAKWSPDSRLFVYLKGGRLYFYPILGDLSTMIDERYRIIGSGGINSVFWGQQGDFFYLQGKILYRIISTELFTRTIYGDFLSAGSVASSLPIEFDSGFDRFWIAPDSKSILIDKSGKTFFIFRLGENPITSASLPFVSIPQGADNFNVLWSSGYLSIISSFNNEPIIWRFEINETSINTLSNKNIPDSSNGALSPDGTRAVFWGKNGLELWDFSTWRPLQRLSRENVYYCVWSSNTQLISGNAKYIEEINISDSNLSRRSICLSNVDEAGFEFVQSGSSRIFARIESEWFTTDGKSSWVPANYPQLQQVSLSSERYRAFLEPQPSGVFENIPMIRSVNSANTTPLISGYSEGNNYFTAGKPQVALCFDLYDDDTGLYQVLSALNRHKIKATFFLNGNFIRQNPGATAVISQSGHETGSLFYAPIDFSDSRYRITQEYIAQGLARNEDEFFRATGKELSLLWHPPFYRSTNFIINAAAGAGYKTVERTIDPGDWLSVEDAVKLNINQTQPSEMIEQIMQKKTNGAIIPIRLGLLPGRRDEYLFQRIDILLEAMIRSGIEIVPVSKITGK